ncbi:MAG: methyltransferase domain-containing protein [Lachnospiraceae bacterium]|nr:methyltransferase domain-containing protein [Lachnospiraceae bacterium]
MRQQVHLQLAKLRRQKGITQQELAEIIGTSFQNISKWENGITMPDITILPVLAGYFHISVDELLGLIPLKNEIYLSEETDTEDFWGQRLEYLLRTRKTSWNLDYLEFLIQKVWKLDRPVRVLDCGCGYGYMGLLMMPLLHRGSTYTGVDFSKELISHGKKLFEKAGIEGDLQEKDFLQWKSRKQYDVVLCQSVLRHVGDSRPFIRKMIDLGMPGSLIICIDTNRELECAGLYVEGMDYGDLCNHQGAIKHWKTEKEKGDRDYAAAMRNAFVMHELGLKNIEVRMNDKMSFVCPEHGDYEQTVEDFVQQNSLWYQKQDGTDRLMSHGMSRKEAENYLGRGEKIENYFSEHESEVSYLQFKGKTITFGYREGVFA